MYYIIDKMGLYLKIRRMIQTSINVTEARDNPSEILGRVKFGQEIVTIEKKGKPYAVIVSPEQYEAFQREAPRRFGAIIRRIRPVIRCLAMRKL